VRIALRSCFTLRGENVRLDSDPWVFKMKKSCPHRNRPILIPDQSHAKGGLPFGEHRAQIVIRERESYLVPMVAKAIDISEHLRVSNSGLSVKDIQGLTRYSSSTIYRILRTLLAFGYVRRDLCGCYKLACLAPLDETNSIGEPTNDVHPRIVDSSVCAAGHNKKDR
jgi:hypothetical protein